MAPSLPPQAGPARESAILDLIAQGGAQITWADLPSSAGGHTAIFRVFADALMIDGLRVNLSAAGEQKAADLLGCSLLTPKLADLIWQNRAVTLAPHPFPIDTTTALMVRHSQALDADLAKQGNPSGLLSTVGKHWVIANGIPQGRAMNYGWHVAPGGYAGPTEVVASLYKDKNGQYGRLIQGCGTRHDSSHADYSQTVVLVSQDCVVDGQPAKLSDVLQSPELAALASHQGPLTILRQPGVPETPVATVYTLL